MANLVTLEAVKSGAVCVEDLLKINALLDMREDMQTQAQQESRK